MASTPEKRKFLGNIDGSTAVVVAVSVLPLLIGAGLAVDVGNVFRVRSNLQTALDSAMLSVATSPATNQFTPANIASTYVTQNFTKSRGLPAPTVAVSTSGKKMTGTATLAIPTTFLKLLRSEPIPVNVTSTVEMGGGDLEIALALDTTASMAGTKLDDLKLAAKDLIDAVTVSVPQNGGTPPRIGMVPFGTYINVGKAYRSAPWMSVPADSTTTSTSTILVNETCTPNPPTTCYSDGVPYSCTFVTCTGGTPTTVTNTYTTTWDGCVGSRDSPAKVDLQTSFAYTAPDMPVPAIMGVGYCGSPLSRLTSDSAALKTQIDGLVASGDTYIPDGLLWAWRVLSPDLPFADGKSAQTSKDVRKVLVLMTDGFNTLEQSGAYHWTVGSPTTSGQATDPLTVELCTNIKAQNVTIFTVAFGVTDARATDLLQKCASGPPFYFTAATGADLRTAFQSIGSSMVTARLVQ